MEIVTSVLLFLVLTGIGYCIRLLRALHTRVNQRTTKVFQMINQLSSDTKRLSSDSYRQIEAFSQLIKILDLKAPIPPTRGWAASPDLLLTITEIVLKTKPSLLVELGSGVSTLVAAKAGARKVVSLDNSEVYGDKTRKLLKEHRVRGVDIRIAPLQPYANGHSWYDLSTIKDLKKIDVLIVDGPPGSDNPEARYPALHEFKSRLSPTAIVILDDVKRDGERKLAEDFARALPNHELVILDHEKGTAVIAPR